MEESYLHNPVLLREITEFLDLTPGKVIIDATLGGAGHAEAIAKRIIPGGVLIGIDRDSETLKAAQERLKHLELTAHFINRNFRDIRNILEDINIGEADGILLDLGVSSIQLETGERGFSIKNNGPLDMRMDRKQGITAKYLVDHLSEFEIAAILRDYGEERYYKRIAAGIVRARAKKDIMTTGELADIVIRNVPYSRKRYKIHPATRTFQALRIKVNEELSSIEDALKDIPYVLRKGGRACVISFHSLEDRIVKNVFKRYARENIFKILTKKPVIAGEEELADNPRARSAKLRIAERL